MNCDKKYRERSDFGHNCKGTHHGHGHSSSSMHDMELVFNELRLKDKDTFLDLGCGPGDYSIKASEMVGQQGVVYALDICKETIEEFAEKIASQKLCNIRPMITDINDRFPIEDRCIDVCLMATVLHGLCMITRGKTPFGEVSRVMKPGGHLAVIECKKGNTHCGPPASMRISPEELEEMLNVYGFERARYLDLGNNYMIQFRATTT